MRRGYVSGHARVLRVLWQPWTPVTGLHTLRSGSQCMRRRLSMLLDKGGQTFHRVCFA